MLSHTSNLPFFYLLAKPPETRKSLYFVQSGFSCTGQKCSETTARRPGELLVGYWWAFGGPLVPCLTLLPPSLSSCFKKGAGLASSPPQMLIVCFVGQQGQLVSRRSRGAFCVCALQTQVCLKHCCAGALHWCVDGGHYGGAPCAVQALCENCTPLKSPTQPPRWGTVALAQKA